MPVVRIAEAEPHRTTVKQTELFPAPEIPAWQGGAPTGEQLARRTDPESSHLAAAEHVASGSAKAQADRIEEAVHRRPGQTAHEIAKLLGDLTQVQVCRRLPYIASVRQGDQSVMRKCAVSKRMCVTWWPKETFNPGD